METQKSEKTFTKIARFMAMNYVYQLSDVMADKYSARFSMVVMGTDNNRQCYRGHLISYSWQFNYLTNKSLLMHESNA